jgi:hypothetical protein
MLDIERDLPLTGRDFPGARAAPGARPVEHAHGVRHRRVVCAAATTYVAWLAGRPSGPFIVMVTGGLVFLSLVRPQPT